MYVKIESAIIKYSTGFCDWNNTIAWDEKNCQFAIEFKK